MMTIEVMTRYVMRCDRCGRRQDYGNDSVEEAIKTAKDEGFLVSEWLHEGVCPRQTHFCKRCVEVLVNKEAQSKS